MKISRIRRVRSRMRQGMAFSILRVCDGESSSSKIATSICCSLQYPAISSNLPGPTYMRAEGCGNRCVKRFTLTISAVSARNSSSSRNSSACRGSWLSRTTATITARSRQSETASGPGVIFLFSVKVVHLILNGYSVRMLRHERRSLRGANIMLQKGYPAFGGYPVH